MCWDCMDWHGRRVDLYSMIALRGKDGMMNGWINDTSLYHIISYHYIMNFY